MTGLSLFVDLPNSPIHESGGGNAAEEDQELEQESKCDDGGGVFLVAEFVESVGDEFGGVASRLVGFVAVHGSLIVFVVVKNFVFVVFAGCREVGLYVAEENRAAADFEGLDFGAECVRIARDGGFGGRIERLEWEGVDGRYGGDIYDDGVVVLGTHIWESR